MSRFSGADNTGSDDTGDTLAAASGKHGTHSGSLWFTRRRLLSAGLLLLLPVAIFLGVSFTSEYAKVSAIKKYYAAFDEERKARPVITDVREALPELAHLAAAAGVYGPDGGATFARWLVWCTGGDVALNINEVYRSTLNLRLLPLVRAAAAEQVVIAGHAAAEYTAAKRAAAVERADVLQTPLRNLNAALRAYLMLHQPEHSNAQFLLGRLQDMWSAAYQGDAEARRQLLEHMQYLITHGLEAAEPDAALVTRARTQLLGLSPAALAYQRIQEQSLADGGAPYSVRASLGGTASPFSGDDYEIPYLYTRAGFVGHFIKHAPAVIASLLDDSWCYGPHEIDLSPLKVQEIYRGMGEMYFGDYAVHWNSALAKLHVRKPADLAGAGALAEQFASAASPVSIVLRDLRDNIELQSSLTSPDHAQDANLAALLTKTQALDAFAAYLDKLLDEKGNPKPPLQATQAAMAAAGAYYKRLAAGDDSDERIANDLLAVAAGKDDAMGRLGATIGQLPDPVQAWYMQVMHHGLEAMFVPAARYINKRYEGVLAVYNNDLRQCFPCNPQAACDAGLDAFSSFFKPGGVLDSFYSSWLAPFFAAGTDGYPAVAGRRLPFSQEAMTQVQRVQLVQRAFFTDGGDLGVTLQMEPYSMDTTLKQTDIAIGDARLSYWHGPIKGVSVTWPAAPGAPAQASMETTELEGFTSSFTAKGDWALFRLLQLGTAVSRTGDVGLVRLTQGGKWIELRIRHKSKSNPLDPAVSSCVLPDSLL